MHRYITLCSHGFPECMHVLNMCNVNVRIINISILSNVPTVTLQFDGLPLSCLSYSHPHDVNMSTPRCKLEFAMSLTSYICVSHLRVWSCKQRLRNGYFNRDHTFICHHIHVQPYKEFFIRILFWVFYCQRRMQCSHVFMAYTRGYVLSWPYFAFNIRMGMSTMTFAGARMHPCQRTHW